VIKLTQDFVTVRDNFLLSKTDQAYTQPEADFMMIIYIMLLNCAVSMVSISVVAEIHLDRGFVTGLRSRLTLVLSYLGVTQTRPGPDT